MRNVNFSDPEYDRWYKRGYDAFVSGERRPNGLTVEQGTAWDAGHDAARRDADDES